MLYNHNVRYAGVAELADAPDLGSGVYTCRFKSCYPHQKALLTFSVWRAFLRGNMVRTCLANARSRQVWRKTNLASVA